MGPSLSDAPPDFQYSQELINELADRTPIQRVKGNLAAIRAIKTIQTKSRAATQEEQAMSARPIRTAPSHVAGTGKPAGHGSCWVRQCTVPRPSTRSTA